MYPVDNSAHLSLVVDSSHRWVALHWNLFNLFKVSWSPSLFLKQAADMTPQCYLQSLSYRFPWSWCTWEALRKPWQVKNLQNIKQGTALLKLLLVRQEIFSYILGSWFLVLGSSSFQTLLVAIFDTSQPWFYILELNEQLCIADSIMPRWMQLVDPGIGFAKGANDKPAQSHHEQYAHSRSLLLDKLTCWTPHVTLRIFPPPCYLSFLFGLLSFVISVHQL